LVVLSAGALADDGLRQRLEAAARASGALLYVPSGGIGALDALKAAVVSGVDEVVIRTAKPPRAWHGIPFVEALGVDLDRLEQPFVLYDGAARAGVAHFPQNVNIAAVLSMAGVGFDRTRLVAVADPGIVRNTHVITVTAVTGEISITLQNIPSPENPKTAWLACYSALAALKQMQSPIRYGT
jgi:aspartate dehydrogenase